MERTYQPISLNEVGKEETLEEAINKQILIVGGYPATQSVINMYKNGAEFGAKWQQKQDNKLYSEEEVLKLLITFSDDRTFLKKDVAIKWFEQFKK